MSMLDWLIILLCWIMAPFFKARARRIHHAQGTAFWLSTMWLTSLYAKHGTDEQLDTMYEIMHGRKGYATTARDYSWGFR